MEYIIQMEYTIQNLIQNPLFVFLILLWTFPWKGLALWKSARLNDKWWFVVLLVINTLGLLEILYIFIFSKRKALTKEEKQKTNQNT